MTAQIWKMHRLVLLALLAAVSCQAGFDVPWHPPDVVSHPNVAAYRERLSFSRDGQCARLMGKMDSTTENDGFHYFDVELFGKRSVLETVDIAEGCTRSIGQGECLWHRGRGAQWPESAAFIVELTQHTSGSVAWRLPHFSEVKNLIQSGRFGLPAHRTSSGETYRFAWVLDENSLKVPVAVYLAVFREGLGLEIDGIPEGNHFIGVVDQTSHPTQWSIFDHISFDEERNQPLPEGALDFISQRHSGESRGIPVVMLFETERNFPSR